MGDGGSIVLDAILTFLKRIGTFSVTIKTAWTGHCKTPMNEPDDIMFINRTDFTDTSTIGELLFNGEFQCYTLEDTCRHGPKIPGSTAIPPGRYEVQISYSTRFKRDLPILLNVQGFTGIRIHPGNDEKSTQGCILVGKDKSVNWIGKSKEAFDLLYVKIEGEIKKGPLYVAIHGGKELLNRNS
jgi:hypothetical protein